MTEYKDRRIFFEFQKNYFQIFSFSQSNDGSIYTSWPDFDKSHWFHRINTGEEIKIARTITPGDGKFTIHGSGISGYRDHSGGYENFIRFRGSPLLQKSKNEAGVRHLFTAQISKPFFLPTSPAKSQKNDYIITSTDIEPSILLFFALPRINMQFEMGIAFHQDDIDFDLSGNPKHILGQGIIELRTHMIIFLSYRTKKMSWPTCNHIFYDDGFMVPIIIGKGDREFKFEYRKPNYTYIEGKLGIEI